jgi:hypothetical protein
MSDTFFAHPKFYKEVFADGAWIETREAEYPATRHMIVNYEDVELHLTYWLDSGWHLHKRKVNGSVVWIRTGMCQRRDQGEITRMAMEGHDV